MTEHLPECPVWRCCKPDERATMHMCICPYDERMAGFVKGYAAGLDAARKAVWESLTAIDALREKS